MDLFEKDPAITRAMALALMRQAHGFLVAAKATEAASLQQTAIDSLLSTAPAPSTRSTEGD